MSLFTGLDEIVTEHEPLAPYTWLRIGGPARYFLRPRNDEELAALLARCRENDLTWRILGHGANLLVTDQPLDGAVIKLEEPGFTEMSFNHTKAVIGAAGSLGAMVLESVRRGLGGAEALAGIPGSLGGAVKMNASGRFGDIGTLVSRVKVVDACGNAFWREKPELLFEYRWSNIDDQIVTAVELELLPDDPKRVLNKMREIWIIKKSTQPLSSRSAGCIFKNPSPDKPAGALIDKAGLKGRRVGGATVSEQHANFITVEGGATFQDVQTLMSDIQKEVYEKFGIELEPEVEIWE